MFLVAGYNSNEMNSTLLPYIVGHTPAGTSSLNMIHYAQSVTTGGWAGYDWGDTEENMARWNSVAPPVYQYDNITAPVALYWSDNDWLVVPTDVATLANNLPNLVTKAFLSLWSVASMLFDFRARLLLKNPKIVSF